MANHEPLNIGQQLLVQEMATSGRRLQLSLTCLREAGLGIAELRRFTALLRTAGPSKDRAEFLRERREELQERLRQMQAALTVLDGKIAHYSALADDPKG